MSKTAAERQAAYRKKRPYAGVDRNGQRRLSTWLDTGPFLALARLARHHNLSQRAMLAKLIVREDDAIMDSLEPGTPEWGRYFAVGQAAND